MSTRKERVEQKAQREKEQIERDRAKYYKKERRKQKRERGLHNVADKTARATGRGLMRIVDIFLIVVLLLWLTSGIINQRETGQNIIDWTLKGGQNIAQFVNNIVTGGGPLEISEEGVYQKDKTPEGEDKEGEEDETEGSSEENSSEETSSKGETKSPVDKLTKSQLLIGGATGNNLYSTYGKREFIKQNTQDLVFDSDEVTEPIDEILDNLYNNEAGDSIYIQTCINNDGYFKL